VPDPRRLQVLKALTVLLEGVVPTAPTIVPALTNLNGRIFRGRARFGDNDPDVMISILESPRGGQPVYTDENQARLDQWSLLVQGWCPDDKDNPSDPLYFFLEDVEKRLDRVVAENRSTGQPKYPEHFMLGGLITNMRFGQGTVRPPTENISSKSFFYVPVQVGLARISSE